MPTDTTEKGLETLIMRHMTGTDGLFVDGSSMVENTPDGIAAQKAGGSGWHAGSPAAYDRAHCIDVTQLFAFLQATQPDTLAKLNIGNYGDAKNMTRQKFLARISSEIGDRQARRDRRAPPWHRRWPAAFRDVLRHPIVRQ